MSEERKRPVFEPHSHDSDDGMTVLWGLLDYLILIERNDIIINIAQWLVDNDQMLPQLMDRTTPGTMKSAIYDSAEDMLENESNKFYNECINEYVEILHEIEESYICVQCGRSGYYYVHIGEKSLENNEDLATWRQIGPYCWKHADALQVKVSDEEGNNP